MALSNEQLTQYLKQGLDPDKIQQLMGLSAPGEDPMQKVSRVQPIIPQTSTPVQPSETANQAMAGNSQNAVTPRMPAALPPQRPQPPQPGGMSDAWKQLEPQALAEIAQQKKSIPELDVYKRAINDQPVQTDLSPLMALTDAWTGSHMAKDYKSPQAMSDKIKSMEDLQNLSQKQRDQITDSLIKLSNAKSVGDYYKDARMNTMNERLKQSQDVSAQKQVQQMETPLFQRADGFARMKDLYQNATDKSKPIEDRVAANDAFQSMLTQEQLRLETGAKTASSVGEKREASYAAQDFAKKMQYFKSHPLDTIPEGELKNAGNILNVMGQSYLDQGNRGYNQLKSRANPAQLPIVENSHKQFLQSYEPILSGKVTGNASASEAQKPASVADADWNALSPAGKQTLVGHLNDR